MTTSRADNSPLRPFMSDAAREQPLRSVHGIEPWNASVIITPIRLRRARSSQSEHQPAEVEFEILAEWLGPPPAGFPPSDRPVQARDLYMAAELELARAIAGRAEDELRAATVPNLRAIARELRAAAGA